jgi:hypothetical protein
MPLRPKAPQWWASLRKLPVAIVQMSTIAAIRQHCSESL